MPEQTVNRVRPETTPGGGFNDIDGPEETSVLVHVATGLYADTLPAAGMTVGEIRRRFADRLDIDPQATAVLDGETTDETTEVRPGQRLAFLRFAGEKGADA